jgi:hypothetical protein
VVVETLRHFVRSYVALQQDGKPGRYVFTTTADPRRRRRRKGELDFDLLQEWRAGERSARVCDGVRSVVAEKEAPDWVKEPVAWLDGRPVGKVFSTRRSGPSRRRTSTRFLRLDRGPADLDPRRTCVTSRASWRQSPARRRRPRSSPST